MSALFDTSVLIAALTSGHPEHSAARARVLQVQQDDQAFISSPTLAELYAVLSGVAKWRIRPQQALRSIELVSQPLTILPLSPEDYSWCLRHMAALGLSGGSIYDCLHARAALNAKVERLYTLNEKHFRRLGLEIAALIERP